MSNSNCSQRRVVVLGASNVVISLPTVTENARRSWGQPLDVLAAIGHGRSFGRTTRVLGRTLPGILQCELWEEWQQLPPKPTAALLTDVGNDLLYGSTPAQISLWVRDCLQRLRPTCERIVMTELPLESAATVGPYRFLFFRTVFFPGKRISWQQTLTNARELNDRMLELAKEFDAHVIRPPLAWYGLDPIHIRRQQRSQAWQQILAPWLPLDQVNSSPPPGVGGLWRYWRARPKYRVLFGVEQKCQQPSLTLRDGTTMSFY